MVDRSAAYGSWQSPLTIDAALGTATQMRELCADGNDLVWLESVPTQDGRFTAMRRRAGSITELTPHPADVRARVDEYGGGAIDARGGSVAWCDDHDGTVCLLTPDGHRHVIARGQGRYRFGDLRIAPDIPAVLAVREESRPDGAPATTIVALAWPGTPAEQTGSAGEVIVHGADFYACPEYSSDGRLAWVEWNLPDMPWDASQVEVGELRVASGRVSVRRIARVAGGGGRDDAGDRLVCAQHPHWLPDGRLAFMSDASGYWNLHLWDGTGEHAVHNDPHDFDTPAWELGNASFGLLDHTHVLASLCDDGVVYLATIDLRTGEVARAASIARVDAIACATGTGYALIARPAGPPALVRLAGDGTLEVLRSAGPAPALEATSIPRSLTVTGPAGPVQAWFYGPTNTGWRGLPGERPPLLVRSHGGPTGLASDAWNADVQFWTSRGFAVVDVNYSGSAGFGRAYRNRLWGQWGVLDVADCVAAVRAVVSAHLADPARVAIAGGSAGGYTTLQALATTDVFAAGVSSYGIGDLELLARDTHKFESGYLDRLVGPYPDQRDLYVARSPIHHLDALHTPMLILQGTDDAVVPPAQAEAMAQAVRTRRLPLALRLFPGEGHGFRKVATRRAALAAQLSFFGQLFGFTPADDIDTLTIENLPVAAPRVPPPPVQASRAAPEDASGTTAMPTRDGAPARDGVPARSAGDPPPSVPAGARPATIMSPDDVPAGLGHLPGAPARRGAPE
jgi:dienelactone hydrolase